MMMRAGVRGGCLRGGLSASSTTTASSMLLAARSAVAAGAQREYAVHIFSPPPLPNAEKPVPPVVERDNKAIFNVFDVPVFYTYQTTPRWRESPAMAHRRAERRRMTEVRKRATVYCNIELEKERERFRQEREQMERWKALRLKKRREEWREKMVVREKVESQERAERAKLAAQNLQVHAEKSKLKEEAKREWLLCIKEELHKFDVADLPHLMSLKNYKYDTYESQEWYTKDN